MRTATTTLPSPLNTPTTDKHRTIPTHPSAEMAKDSQTQTFSDTDLASAADDTTTRDIFCCECVCTHAPTERGTHRHISSLSESESINGGRSSVSESCASLRCAASSSSARERSVGSGLPAAPGTASHAAVRN
jgi:hypothetical protein